MEETIILQLTGLMLIVVSLPLIFGKIKPNRWYGFRTPTTLSNDKIWYEVNKKTSIDLCILGLLIILSSLFIGRYEDYFVLFPFLVVGGTLLMLVRGMLLIDKMRKDDNN